MSTDKKAQSRAERDEKRRQEEQKDRRAMAVYTAVGVIVVVAAIALMVINSGVLQRGLTARTVGGVKYSAADMQYFYNNAYTNYANNYAFDTSTSVRDQVYDEATGQSWYDFLMESATETLALAAQAQSEGFALPEETRSQLNASLSQLSTAWMSYGYASRDAFIRANFGPHMTYDRLAELMEVEYLASGYISARLDAIDHPDADYDAYYQAHTDELDTITYTQFAFQAMVPTTDDQGNEITLTDGEKAERLEQLKTEQKALAEEVKAKLEAGESPEDLAEEYADQVYSSSVSRASTGSNVSYSSYGDWLLDSARKAGDITLTERDSDTAYYYYVAVFEGRALDEEPTNNVRHILIRAGSAVSSEEPTQEEYDQAEEKAQSILDEWKAGEATEESFVELVSANSDDTGSAQSGGLISNVTSTSSYVETFRDWAIDPARREGDAELVKSEYGWHIMYYVSSGDPIWRQNTAAALSNQDYEQLAAAAVQEANVTQGAGMRFVKA